MLVTQKEFKLADKLKHNLETVPPDVKYHVGESMTEENLSDFVLNVDDEGIKGFDNFDYLCGGQSKAEMLPKFLEFYKDVYEEEINIEIPPPYFKVCELDSMIQRTTNFVGI